MGNILVVSKHRKNSIAQSHARQQFPHGGELDWMSFQQASEVDCSELLKFDEVLLVKPGKDQSAAAAMGCLRTGQHEESSVHEDILFKK
jgi:hypothetical protein